LNTLLLVMALAAQQVSAPPASLNADPFYGKHIDVMGLPILSSSAVSDKALREAAWIARRMLSAVSPKVVEAMRANNVRIAIIGSEEQTTDIPEYRNFNTLFPGTDWNARTRGVGATKRIPVVSGAEENLLCWPSDRYRGENIFLHEFAHTIADLGLKDVDPNFDGNLRTAFADARKAGLWDNTYAATNPSEYWAEGVQSYFDANRRADPPNGVHNHVATREELRYYDLRLYELIDQVFQSTLWRWRPVP
jgi:hypothetical protein